MAWNNNWWTSLLLSALQSVGALGGLAAGMLGAEQDKQNSKNTIKKMLKDKYGDTLSDTQLDALYAQYYNDPGMFNMHDPRSYLRFLPGGHLLAELGTGLGIFPNYSYNTFDFNGADKLLKEVDEAYEKFGNAPEMLTANQLEEIEQNAAAEIDAENRQILDLYDQTFDRSTEMLDQGLMENTAAFSDYRNQVLTNDMMNQQAIAGSTRYELDRQQRNAITRGASAAQRLVANINTQLGTQAQSAQQSLETSNALAQQLLTHRQAQTGLRQDYTAALNQRDMNRAGQLSGLAERKLNYGQGKVGWAMDKNQYARDAWSDRVSNYFQGNSLGEGIYRNKYGSGKNNTL